jgi:WD40 repeat protein
MNMRLPLRLLYTMAVILAVLTTLFLILKMALKISDLLASSSTSQTQDKSRSEATMGEKPESVHDCKGSSALHDAEGMTGRIAYICNGDIYGMNLDTGKATRRSHGANYLWLDWSSDGEKLVFNVDGPPGAKRGLYTVNTDGGDLTRISRPGIVPGSSGYTEVCGMTGSSWAGVLIYAGFPPLILALVAQWFGGRLATWYEKVAPRSSATMEVPALWRTLRREKSRRIAYATLALLMLVLIAAGFRLYQTRAILTRIPSSEAALSRDGERAAVLTTGGFAVYSVPEGQRLHALPLSEEAYEMDSALWASNGRFLATSDGERVHVYDASKQAEIARLPVKAAQLAWSQEGYVTSGRYLRTLEGDSESGVSFSPDGRHIASHGSDETVRIWPVEERSP